MDFSVLGPLEAYQDGGAVAIGGGRQRALLALLLIHAGEVVSRDRLIDELWDGEPPASASQSLDAYLSRLRRAFREAGADDILVTRAPGYLLTSAETDATRFEALVQAGREALGACQPSSAAALLREALDLWRGDAYAEVADAGWAVAEVAHLDEVRRSAGEARIEADIQLGRHPAVVPELERLVAQDPTREGPVGQLMLALYRCGRQADALAVYQALRHSLVENLGLEPGPELRRLQAAVLAQDPSLDLPVKTDTLPRRATAGRRSAARWVVGATALGAIVLVAALAWPGGDATHRTVSADSAGAIDPASGHVVESVAVGSGPAAITSGARRIWVTNSGDGTVTRIDPADGQVDQTITVGSSPAGLAAGDGALWVANALDGSVSRIAPDSGQVVQTIHVGRRPVAVTVGAGSVWVADADGDAIVPLDPRSGTLRPPVRLQSSPGGVAVGFGSVWVPEPLAHQLVRIDPHSGDTVAAIAVGAGAGPVAIGAGAVWVVNALDGTLSRIDPARNTVTSAVEVGDGPTAVAATDHAVWVADEGDGQLVAVDPRSRTVARRFAVGAAPVGVAIVGHTPWVAAGSPPGRQHRGGTLRVRADPISALDPAMPSDVHPAIWRATGDGLVALSDTVGAAQLVPDLATTVPQPTDDGRTYAFRLRPGLRYSTGVAVHPSDLRRELERLYATRSTQAAQYSALVGATTCSLRPPSCDLSHGVVTDDAAGTVILRLTHPDPEMLFKLALPGARPVPPGTPRAQIATRGVPSTGPYRIAAFVPGQRLLLTRNPRFHEWSRAAQPDGYPDRIDIRMSDDPDARAAAVLHHGADLALEVASANVAQLRLRFPSQVRRHRQPDTRFLTFNVHQPPFDDVRARQAVNLAIDRGDLARRLGGNGLSTPTCQVLPPNFPGHQDYCPWTRPPTDGRWHGTDLPRARALVRASGTVGANVDVVANRSDPSAVAEARVLDGALRKIGYQPRPSLVTGEALGEKLGTPSSWNISDGDWIADYPSPGEFLDYFLSCSNYDPGDPARSTNGGGFCRHDFDRLIAHAERLQLSDPVAAQTVWAQADRLAVDDAAWVPTVNTSSIELLSRRTGHFTLDADSLPQIDQLWVR